MGETLTVAGTLLAAVLAYVLGARQDRRSRLHDERIAATSAFCRALMDYRGAQIHRWHVDRTDPEGLGEARAAVRDTRSAAWACYFRVVLVVDHAPASRACRVALEAARALRLSTDADSLDAAGGEVRQLTEVFVGEVASKLGIEPVSLAEQPVPTDDPDLASHPGWVE